MVTLDVIEGNTMVFWGTRFRPQSISPGIDAAVPRALVPIGVRTLGQACADFMEKYTKNTRIL